MHYLYLDESGNLGFDIRKTGTSRYFVVTVLETSNSKYLKAIEKAVARTIKHKIRGKRLRQRVRVEELKGAKTAIEVKKYFFNLIKTIPFNLYCVIFDKQHIIDQELNKDRVYNFLTHLAIKSVPLDEVKDKVFLTLDKCKNKPEIQEFNESLINQVESRVPPHIPLIVSHDDSQENKALQAVDLFAWGIYRKYEWRDRQWYDIFQSKIVYEKLYQHSKNKKRK